MPKGSHYVTTKSTPYGKGRKSKKKRRTARYPAPLAAKQAPLPRSISAAASARLAPRIQQIAPQHPYVLSELKRSGIIAGAMLLLLIILSLVL